MKLLALFFIIISVAACESMNYRTHKASGLVLPLVIAGHHRIFDGDYQDESSSSQITYVLGSSTLSIYFRDNDVASASYFQASSISLNHSMYNAITIEKSTSNKTIEGKYFKGNVYRVHEKSNQAANGPISIESVGVWDEGDKIIKIRISQKGFVGEYTKATLEALEKLEDSALAAIVKAQIKEQ